MPYIKQEMRDRLNKQLQELIKTISKEDRSNLDGVLNYCIYVICSELYKDKYIDFNAMMGMLECCKQELYRKRVAPYEDYKESVNGEI